MEAYVGLDVHSKPSVFVIEREDGHVVARGDMPTTPEGFRELRQQHELPAETPVALELRISCGAVLPAPKRGAAVSTPNGRLVSEEVIGRRIQSPPAPRAGRRRSSPPHTRMRLSRSPPVRDTVGSPNVGGPRTLPRSSSTARLHGRTFAEFSPAP
jgi:hypothetical protein